MPPETFAANTYCEGSTSVKYVKHKNEVNGVLAKNPDGSYEGQYKIYPTVFLTDQNGNKPSTSSSKFEEAKQMSQPINAGIFINAPACKLTLGSSLKTKNWVYAWYTGRIPLVFYGDNSPPKIPFKLMITNNDLDQRTFSQNQDLAENTTSRDMTTAYQQV
jgi:hypothetical protein